MLAGATLAAGVALLATSLFFAQPAAMTSAAAKAAPANADADGIDNRRLMNPLLTWGNASVMAGVRLPDEFLARALNRGPHALKRLRKAS